jgi:hypothetical protein
MQYLLMIYNNEAGLLAAKTRQHRGALRGYSEAMAKAGVVLGGNWPRPTQATTVRVKDGKTEVLDGPYADTGEQLGGITCSTCPISTRRCPGRRAARPRRTARSRSARSGP